MTLLHPDQVGTRDASDNRDPLPLGQVLLLRGLTMGEVPTRCVTQQFPDGREPQRRETRRTFGVEDIGQRVGCTDHYSIPTCIRSSV